MGNAGQRTILPLLTEIAACRHCAAHLPHGPRPVVQAGPQARLVIIGHALSRRVHDAGIPWNDLSGKPLREWLDMPSDMFYDPACVATMPTAFCYPGKGKSGDLPPRPECAPRWHARLLAAMPNVRLMLLVGRHAQETVLQQNGKATLTETVAAWRDYQPAYFPLPHPSPRNQAWWKHNPWFDTDVLPALRERVHSIFKT